MKQIIDNIWNASPSAILTPIGDAAQAILIGWAIGVVIVLIIAWILWKRF